MPGYWTLRLVVLILLLVLFIVALPHIAKLRALTLQLVFAVLFCVATGFVTAAGRLNFGISQAAVSRYQTIALLFWCFLGLLWLGGCFFAGPRMPRLFLVAQLCLLTIFVQAAIRASASVATARMHAFTQNTASAALLTGVSDPDAFRNVIYPEPDMFTVTIPYLKVNRLSVFSDSLASTLNRPLDSTFRVLDSSACSGALEAVIPVNAPLGPVLGRGIRIAGWAWDGRNQTFPSAIVVTNRDAIVGVGATGGPRPEGQSTVSRSDGFTAFVPDLPPGSTANFYAILHGSPKTACLIGRLAVD